MNNSILTYLGGGGSEILVNWSCLTIGQPRGWHGQTSFLNWQACFTLYHSPVFCQLIFFLGGSTHPGLLSRMCEHFVGTWKLISSENFEDYMRELGE